MLTFLHHCVPFIVTFSVTLGASGEAMQISTDCEPDYSGQSNEIKLNE